jgi:CheY-like chemotaxis protein
MPAPIRVLLVEDNPGDAELTRDMLESGKLHLVIDNVKDGVEALSYLRRLEPHGSVERPDLILLDLNLPRMGGRELLAEIKNDEDLRVIPVVVLTSSDSEQDVVGSYALGANCYVTKPVSLAGFQSIVKAVESFWFTIVRLP